MKTPIVSICCITYNHASYIRECLDGFLMQKTTFPIEILIFDDASIDHTQEIIKDFARKDTRIKTFLQIENQWSKGKYGLIDWLFPRARGKYIALCEGDDYWTDPYKLQKQVDFLEANPKMSAVVHPSKIINVLKKIESTTERNLPVKLKYQHILSSRKFHTNSIVFKSEIMQNFITGVYSGDRAMYFLCMANGPIGFINEIMSVYRVTGTGASSTLDYKKIKTDFKIIPWIKRIDPKFPARDFRVYLYKTLYYVTYTNKSVIRFYYFMALLFAIVLSKAYNIKDFYYYIKSR